MNTLVKKDDCAVIINDLDSVVDNIGNCFDTVFDEKKKNIGLVSNLFSLFGSVIRLTFHTGGCVVKHTPTAVVAVTKAKRELTTVIEEEIALYKKENLEQQMKDEIRLLQEKI